MKCQVYKYIKQQQKINPAFSVSGFARSIGVTRQLIYLHKKNPALPWRKSIAHEIERASNGAIKAIELVMK